METMWQVTYAIDSLDPNPTVKTFDTEHEAIDWLNDEMQGRIDHIVQHSPYSLTEKDLSELQERESSLARIDRI